MATKVLVAGDVQGRLTQLFDRVAAVNDKHGPFHAVFCVGDFFGAVDELAAAIGPYRAGDAKAPLRTYFLGPAAPSESVTALMDGIGDGGELAPDIIFLGGGGIKTLHGELR